MIEGNKKLLSIVIGLLALISLIWFALPKIGLDSVAWRCFLIMLVIVVTMGSIFAKRYWVLKKGEKLKEELQAQRESVAGRQLEIAVLKEKMDEAIDALKTSELSVQYRGSSALYALPWFMVIGPAAAGKSTLLRHSGLHFPLASQDEIRVKGYGGTRNCDWWFSDEAILLDTAGRYTTEDDDREEWKTFLQLIKKNRPKLPINGILVVMSLTEILNADDDSLRRHVKLIRERIAEMTSELGYLFPVTLVFTKMDLLTGFNEFFSGLDEKRAKDVLGIYLGELKTPQEKIQAVKEKLGMLYEKMSGLSFPKLNFQKEHLNKLSLLGFPENFHYIEARINQFAGWLFKENPYQETPHFAGIYFTSSLEDAQKSYFIRNLFSQVIFPNHDVKNKKSRGHRLTLRWLKSASVIGGIVTALAAFLLYSASFASNALLLRQGVRAGESALESDNNVNVLTSLATYVNNLENYRQSMPLHLRLGLYRGEDVLPPLEKILSSKLNQLLLPVLANGLENQLAYDQEQWALGTPSQDHAMRGDYYTTLKVYLMLCHPEHMDATLATEVLSSKFKGMHGMVYFYVRHMTTHWVEKPDLVQLSRQQLYSPTNINNLYAEFKSKGIDQLGSISAQQLVSHKNSQFFDNTATIPVLFTQNGFNNYAENEIDKLAQAATEGDWVMGSYQPKATPQEAHQFKKQLTQLYWSDYESSWVQFLDTVRLKPFTSFDEASKKLTEIVASHGPVVNLLTVAEQNLHRVKQIDVSQYLKKVLAIKNILEGLAVSSDPGRDSQHIASQLLSGNDSQSALYVASVDSNQLVTGALQNILLMPVKESWRLILNQATQGLQSQWQAQVVSVYQQSLANKFPFAKNGDDVDRGDLSHFFDPTSGVLWQFVNQNLMPYLAQTANGWQARTWLGIGAGFSPDFLTELTQAKSISNGFFEEGSSPKFSFQLYPEPTPGLKEISVTTNGQTYRYRNDPQEWQTLHWPGNEPNDDTVLEIVTTHDSQGTLEINSIWGFFKLLQKASLSPGEGSSLRASFDMRADNGRHYRVSFMVKSSQSDNLFKHLLVNQFYLPAQLFNDVSNN